MRSYRVVSSVGGWSKDSLDRNNAFHKDACLVVRLSIVQTMTSVLRLLSASACEVSARRLTVTADLPHFPSIALVQVQAEFRECVPVVDSCRICTRGVILESVLRY